MSCNCNPCHGACDPENEPLSSALNNFSTSFFGSVTKTCVNNQVTWVLPCNLDSGMPGYPRVANEGVACYLVRVFGLIIDSIPTTTGIKVTDADTNPDNLQPKTSAGNEIVLTVLNSGGNEQLQISYQIPVSSSIPASDIDWSLSYTFFKTLSGNTAFTFSNDQDGKTIIVAITNTAGNFTATWPVAVQWRFGNEPVLTLGASTDVFTFVKINNIINGSVVQQFS